MERETSLARNHGLKNAVLGQKLAEAGPVGKEPLNTAVGKNPLQGKLLRQLHLHLVPGSEMEAAMKSLLALGPGVEQGKHLSAGIHGGKETVHNGADEWFRKIVEGCPEQDGIEGTSGEIENLVKKRINIPDRISGEIVARDPVSAIGILNQIGEEDTVPQPGEVVDVGRRGVADVNEAEAGIGLKPLAQGTPPARMASEFGPRQSRDGGDGIAGLFFFKQTPEQPGVPLAAQWAFS